MDFSAQSPDAFRCRRVLFPTDFSIECNYALPYLANVARKMECEILLLHVIDKDQHSDRNLTENREEAWDSFGKEKLSGLPVTRILESGNTTDCILEIQKSKNADLIFLPTHITLNPAGEIGAIATKVLANSACPVWTTAHSELLQVHSFQEVRNILCSVGLSEETTQLLRAAQGISARFGATLRLIHVLQVSRAASQAGADAADSAARTVALLDNATERIEWLQAEAKTDVEFTIEFYDAPTAIRQAVELFEVQLVLTSRRLGSEQAAAGAIVAGCPCPVLSL